MSATRFQVAGLATAPPPRRIVMCLDGTANSAFTERRRANGMKVIKPTNVLKLARAVVPWDPRTHREQIVYYDTGVGSLGLYPGLPNRALRANDKLWGGLGAGFEANVEDALHFLSLNIRSQDEVFIFGFSRGAATAQAITRFLEWAGGLPAKSDAYFLPHLFREFLKHRAEKPVGEVIRQIDETTRQRKTKRPDLAPFRPVVVKFLGLWDTVMALGSRIEAVGDTTSDSRNGFYRTPMPAACVEHARHALAIDETRFDFRPEVWQGQHPNQTLRQRWFAGVHSNVGGSYPDDGLANVSFRWMLQEAAEHGLAVEDSFIQFYRPFPFGRMYDSHKLSYKVFDALRFRLGRGVRSLVGHPSTANVDVDRSVIERMLWMPGQEGRSQMSSPYRPRNVLHRLACEKDLRAFLEALGLDEARIARFEAEVGPLVTKSAHDCSEHGAAGDTGGQQMESSASPLVRTA